MPYAILIIRDLPRCHHRYRYKYLWLSPTWSCVRSIVLSSINVCFDFIRCSRNVCFENE
jgi:hypothetical protein